MGDIVGTPVKRSPVKMFRLEISGKDIGATKVGPPKIVLNSIDTMPGGSITLGDHTTNGYKSENIPVERPMTDDRTIVEWVRKLKQGQQDKRQCTIYMQDASGADLYQWDLKNCLVADYSATEMDGSTVDQEQKEMFTLKPEDVGDRIDL